jgi:hypothetical protein
LEARRREQSSARGDESADLGAAIEGRLDEELARFDA